MKFDKDLTPITQRIDDLLRQRESILVAIDGRCTAGKTTLAAKLSELYDCNVIHMDDFFLRPDQRTAERYGEIGGNVDYERFLEEVVTPLKAGISFSFRPFDCKTLTLSEPVMVSPKQLTIIEGSYSIHPFFRNPYDLKILLSVSPDVQRSRVFSRPFHLQERFFRLWIPMENRYLDEFQIREQCDFVL